MNLKYLLFISIKVLLCAALLQSCKGESPQRPAPVLTQDQINANQARTQTPVVPAGSVGERVMHYICPNGHLEGGSDAQGTCITCGATLAHNAAWHTQQQATNPQTPAPAMQAPAQNAAGVWHYICPNGHAGGAGSATACPDCGATLIHNQAYHQS